MRNKMASELFNFVQKQLSKNNIFVNKSFSHFWTPIA